MKRAVIILNGDPPSKSLLKQTIQKDDLIICADGGAEYALASEIMPHVVIGDFDSLSQVSKKRLAKSATVITYPRDKDETDSELVIIYALEQGCTEITILGAWGDRADHVVSNILLFASYSNKIPITIVSEKQIAYITQSDFTFKGKKGDLVSLIPLVSDVKGITTHGLSYALSNESLIFGKTRGVSNVIVDIHVSLHISSGILLIVHTFS